MPVPPSGAHHGSAAAPGVPRGRAARAPTWTSRATWPSPSRWSERVGGRSMRVVLQRVRASVRVDGEDGGRDRARPSAPGRVHATDDGEEQLALDGRQGGRPPRLPRRGGQMNLGPRRAGGDLLVVSQFTLYGDTRRAAGRASWTPPCRRSPCRSTSASWRSLRERARDGSRPGVRRDDGGRARQRRTGDARAGAGRDPADAPRARPRLGLAPAGRAPPPAGPRRRGPSRPDVDERAPAGETPEGPRGAPGARQGRGESRRRSPTRSWSAGDTVVVAAASVLGKPADEERGGRDAPLARRARATRC